MAKNRDERGTFVYLLHFNEKLHHAQHYMGSTDNLPNRLLEHLRGESSSGRLPQVFKDNGVGFKIARVWVGTEADEYDLKRRKEGRRLCPLCGDAKPVKDLPTLDKKSIKFILSLSMNQYVVDSLF